MSISTCRRYASAQTAKATAAVSSCSRRRIASAARTTAARKSAKPTTPVSPSSCSARLCGSLVGRTKCARLMRCASSNDAAPLPSSGRSRNMSSDCLHQSRRASVLAQERRPAPCPQCAPAGLVFVFEPCTATTTTPATQARPTVASSARNARRETPADGCSRDADATRTAEDERGERLQSPVERDPRRRCDQRDEDAAARVREQDRRRRAEHEQHAVEAPLRGTPETEHEREHGELRERVRMSDRRTQSRGVAVVRVERRNDLREQRVADRRCENDRDRIRDRAPRRHSREEEADDEEREVHDAAVDVVPRAVGQDRPADRDPEPEHEGRVRGHEAGAERTERGQRQPAEQRGGARERGEEDGGTADPGQPRRRLPGAEEDGPEENAGGRREQRPRSHRVTSRNVTTAPAGARTSTRNGGTCAGSSTIVPLRAAVTSEMRAPPPGNGASVPSRICAGAVDVTATASGRPDHTEYAASPVV